MINTIVSIDYIKDFPEQGFYSHSYLGFDERLNRKVAVKDIRVKSKEESLEEYYDEAKKLSIASHPHVLPVYYVGKGNNIISNERVPRIVTKYLQNGSLNDLLRVEYDMGRTICLEEGLRFAHQVIQGMIHLHSNDIVHLDLKASNLLIGDDGKVVIADFGQSRFIDDDILTDVRDLYPILNPPEVWRKRVADKTADIYQFGLLLYSIFNYDKYRYKLDQEYKLNTQELQNIFLNQNDEGGGREEEKEAFKARAKALSKDIREGRFPDREDYHYFVPKEVKGVINKCLAVDVGDRYNNFYEIQAELNAFKQPDGVNCVQSLLTEGKITFDKNGSDCCVEIEQIEDKFNIRPVKNGRNLRSKYREAISHKKLSRNIYSLIEEV